LPQALQKWAARMVPQDQQVAVASLGVIKEELGLDSIAINAFTTNVHLFAWACEARTAASWKETSRAWVPAPHHQPENEVPQPHDFVEFGFTNTKPCCISVSW
jgi:hypothetical protein